MRSSWYWLELLAPLLALSLAGCAVTTTHTAHAGPLPGGDPLVTLIVSDSRDVVAKECEYSDPRIVPRLLGCRREDVARLRNGDSSRRSR